MNYRVGKIELEKDIVDPHYLYYTLSRNSFTKELIKKSQGGAQPNISKPDFEGSIIPVLSLEEQKKIADCLSTFDDAIEDLQNTVEHWKIIKKGLLQQLFA